MLDLNGYLRIYISDPMNLELRLSGSSRSSCTGFWSQSSELFLSETEMFLFQVSNF